MRLHTDQQIEATSREDIATWLSSASSNLNANEMTIKELIETGLY
jgi:hypothetical protein